MKTFFIWMIVQCVFARILIGMVLELWASLKVGPDYLSYFIFPAALICIVETITSCIVVLPLVDPRNLAQAEQIAKQIPRNC